MLTSVPEDVGRVGMLVNDDFRVELFEIPGAERLRALNVDFVWDVRVHEDMKVLFVRDNTGNLVELVEPVAPADDERTSQPWRAPLGRMTIPGPTSTGS